MSVRSTLVCLLLAVPLLAQDPPQDAGAPPAPLTALRELELAATSTPLLADHLTLRLPEVGKSEARAANLMGAPEPDQDETRLVIDAGEQRLVLMVRELHHTAAEPLAERVATYYEPLRKKHESIAVTPLDPPLEGELKVLLVQPAKVDVTSTAVPIFWAVVAHKDGSLQELGFYVNPAGARDLPAAEVLARKMLATLGPGSRTQSRAARDQGLGDDKSHLRLDLPADMDYVRQVGVDFVVNRLSIVVPLGEAGGQLGIYEGGHPQKLDDAVTRVAATILGQPAEWRLSDTQGDAGPWFSAEVIVPHPTWGDGVLHCFIGAPSKEVRERLMNVAGTLRVVP